MDGLYLRSGKTLGAIWGRKTHNSFTMIALITCIAALLVTATWRESAYPGEISIIGISSEASDDPLDSFQQFTAGGHVTAFRPSGVIESRTILW